MIDIVECTSCGSLMDKAMMVQCSEVEKVSGTADAMAVQDWLKSTNRKGGAHPVLRRWMFAVPVEPGNWENVVLHPVLRCQNCGRIVAETPQIASGDSSSLSN